jgi:hypothetical protein
VEDSAMWVKVALRGGVFYYTDKPLLRYRKRATSISASSIGMIRANLGVVKAIRESEPNLTAEQLRLLDEREQWLTGKLGLFQGKQDLRDRNYQRAKANLALAAKYFDPSWKLKAINQLLKIAPGLVRTLEMRRGGAA